MSKLQTALIAVAVASAKDHILWEINNANDTWSTPESKNEYANIIAEKDAAIAAYIAAGGLVTNVSIIGALTGGSGMSHYDIDDAVKKEFGDRVCADSESGGFYLYTDATVAGEVVAFLGENYPDLHFSSSRDDENTHPLLMTNWNTAEAILTEVSMTIDYAPDIPVPVKDADEINGLLDQAVHALVLTGLATKEEAELTLSGYREAAV
jgi:hypothetical protein